MGFKRWLSFHVKTVAVVIGALFVALVGMGAFVAEMTILGIVVLVASGVMLMYARYRYREYDIQTQQRKYGRR